MFLPPGSFDFRYKARDSPRKAEHREKNYDEEMYPELYRKYKSASDYIKGSNLECPKPFEIGEYRVVSLWGRNLSQCTYVHVATLQPRNWDHLHTGPVQVVRL